MKKTLEVLRTSQNIPALNLENYYAVTINRKQINLQGKYHPEIVRELKEIPHAHSEICSVNGYVLVKFSMAKVYDETNMDDVSFDITLT